MIEDEKEEISYIEGMRIRGAEFEDKFTVISLTHPFIELSEIKRCYCSNASWWIYEVAKTSALKLSL